MPDEYLHRHIAALYPEHADRVLTALGELPAYTGPQPPAVKALYVTYADSFAAGEQPGSFATLQGQLPAVRALGCNAVHVLPFLKSPCMDGGFDISDYYHVRAELGGDTAFDEFLAAAQADGMTVFMDLVLNHISDEHEWFVQADSGNEYYRSLFVWSEKEPSFVGPADKEGPAATYVFGGNEITLRIIFPDQAGPIPHFRKGKHGWYYHTFYPQQIDLDWNNPDVFIEFAKVLIHWARKGVSFRLDAIAFIGKDIQVGVTDSTVRTHHIIAALHRIATTVNPRCQFLVEVTNSIPQIAAYFGSMTSMDEVAVAEADFAYHFPLTAHLWCAVVTGDTRFLWDTITYPMQLPPWAQWVTFLRNHDSLSHKFLPEELSAAVEEKLLPLGLPFAKGNEIVGRTASFLEHDVRRIVLAHALLASVPGVPAIIYGDEYGKTNDLAAMKYQTALKQRRSAVPVSDDGRDINRGYVSAQEMQTAQATEIAGSLSAILHAREPYSLVAPRPLSGLPAHVFGAAYAVGQGTLVVLCNIGDKAVAVAFRAEKTVLALNSARYEAGTATLPAYGVLWLEI